MSLHCYKNRRYILSDLASPDVAEIILAKNLIDPSSNLPRLLHTRANSNISEFHEDGTRGVTLNGPATIGRIVVVRLLAIG